MKILTHSDWSNKNYLACLWSNMEFQYLNKEFFDKTSLRTEGNFAKCGPSVVSKLIWLTILVSVSSTSLENAESACEFNGEYVSKALLQHLHGWKCFTEATSAQHAMVYVCGSPEGYKIPCLKNGSVYLDFASQESRLKIFSALPDLYQEEIHWCFFDDPECKNSAQRDYEITSRIWMPGTNTSVCSTETRNKFHIAMLSISFIVGVPAVIIISYLAWYEDKSLLKIARNLLAAITLRSLLTLLLQTEVILPTTQGVEVNNYGIPALSTFETLTLNLVLGFWLVLMIFVGKIISERYKEEEPDISLYNYGIIGLSVFFTIIWLIVMASTQTLEDWLGVRYWSQWLNDPLRICFLAFQFYAMCSTLLIQMKEKDPELRESGRRIKIVFLYIFILTPIFILQFCLNAGTPTSDACEEPYFYTMYFIDGTQGLLVSILFFYVDSEVVMLVKDFFGLNVKTTSPTTHLKISTIDSLREKRFSSDNPDVMYSSVVTPDRYEKVLGLYQKQNVSHKPSVVVVDGELFQTCSSEAVRKMSVSSQYFDAVSYEGDFTVAPEINDEDLHTAKNESSRESNHGQRSSITPVHNSKYSSFNRSSGSSTTESVNSSVDRNHQIVVSLAGLDGSETRDDQEEHHSLKRSVGVHNLEEIDSDSNSTSSDDSGTSLFEGVTLREHFQPDNSGGRHSTIAVRGSASDASDLCGVDSIPVLNIPTIMVSSPLSSPEDKQKIRVATPRGETSSEDEFDNQLPNEPKMMTRVDVSDDSDESSSTSSESERDIESKDEKRKISDQSYSFSEDDNYETILKKPKEPVPVIDNHTFIPEHKIFSNDQNPTQNSKFKNETTDHSPDKSKNAVELLESSSSSESSSDESDGEKVLGKPPPVPKVSELPWFKRKPPLVVKNKPIITKNEDLPSEFQVKKMLSSSSSSSDSSPDVEKKFGKPPPVPKVNEWPGFAKKPPLEVRHEPIISRNEDLPSELQVKKKLSSSSSSDSSSDSEKTLGKPPPVPKISERPGFPRKPLFEVKNKPIISKGEDLPNELRVKDKLRSSSSSDSSSDSEKTLGKPPPVPKISQRPGFPRKPLFEVKNKPIISKGEDLPNELRVKEKLRSSSSSDSSSDGEMTIDKLPPVPKISQPGFQRKPPLEIKHKPIISKNEDLPNELRVKEKLSSSSSSDSEDTLGKPPPVPKASEWPGLSRTPPLAVGNEPLIFRNEDMPNELRVKTKLSSSSSSDSSSDSENALGGPPRVPSGPTLLTPTPVVLKKEPVISRAKDMPCDFLVRATPVDVISSESSDSDGSKTKRESKSKPHKHLSDDSSNEIDSTDSEPKKLPLIDNKKIQSDQLDKDRSSTNFSVQGKPAIPLRRQMPVTPLLDENLPDIYNDLKAPPTRPKSLAADKKESFSKMFSNHRNKFLSSKSADDILVRAVSSPAQVKPVEDELTRKPRRRSSSSSSTSSSSSQSSATSHTTAEKYPIASPRLVLQSKGDNEWEPQNVSFT